MATTLNLSEDLNLARRAPMGREEKAVLGMVKDQDFIDFPGYVSWDTLWPSLMQGNLPSEGITHSLSHVDLLSPYPKASRIIAVGMNYHHHCQEIGWEPPPHPVFFGKWPSSLAGPYDTINLPADSQKVDYEIEMALVIGESGFQLNVQDADQVIFGVTIANDVTARDVQHLDKQFTRSKSYPGFCPCGPVLSRVPDCSERSFHLRSWVNDELRQDATTDDMIFKPREIVAALSQVTPVEPGDLILTGTPAGVGVFMDPRIYLKAGDRCRMEIEGLGFIENVFRA